MTVVAAEILKVYLPSCLCLFSLVALIKFLDKVWRRPIHVQSVLRSQGVKGPSYKILHGNIKEIHVMRNKMLSSPMELSHQIYPRILPHVYLWTKLHGKNYVSWKGSKPELVVTEPELVREILNNKDGKYPKPHVQSFLKKIFGDGIIVTKGEKWFKLRKLANHAFHGGSLKTMIPQMIASTETMLKRWEKHERKEIEVFKEFKVFTSETISRTAFGSSYLEGQQIFDVLTRMTLIFSRNHHRTIKLFRTKDDDESDKLEKGLRKCIIELVKKREDEARRGEPGFYGHDFLGQLMKLYHETDKAKRITLDDLIDECKNFYIAGQDTTSSALTWTVFLLAINLDWQEKVRNEVLEQFGQQIPSAEGIARLKMMNMTINESLRLYPPIAGSPREVQKGARLGDLILPSKMEVFVPTLPLHTDPQIWGDDVHVFRPERFEGGVAKATNNNTSAFLPFSLGPRSCVGMNFAITELKIALTMILQRYRFSLSPSYVHSPVIHIAMCPQHGLQIMLRPLSSNTCSTST
ncbi:hypothetical protein K2173_015160 [Erythroxylum novogranatense]|uniref:Cytochrome P450 n=1 Tax=Erythroxylum novogranatense TaxID=1862640 RepID=A0AAV8T2Q7_9ROSI|nr:hypothetical protein K2173_015160 [Erythroxylum novogranatense]